MASLANLALLPFLLLGVVVAQDPLEFDITEEFPPNTFVGSVLLEAGLDKTYPDTDLQFEFLPQPNQDPSYFSISRKGGVIHIAKQIDRDSLCPMQTECFLAIDAAVVYPREYFQVIPTKIRIDDLNDHVPEFPEKSTTVRFSEALEAGSTANLERAIDLDSPPFGVKDYMIVTHSQEFELRFDKSGDSPSDLQIVMLRALDREIKGSYELEIVAIDGGSTPNTGTVTVTVEVEDANDHSPWFENTNYEIEVPESQQTDVVFYRMEAVDNDAGQYGNVVYKLSEPQNPQQATFGINPETGEIHLVEALDFEKAELHELEITASDKGPNSMSAQATLVVRVKDVNDDAPVVTVNTLTSNGVAQVYENTEPGDFVAHVSVFDGDAGVNGEVQCILNHPAFVLLTMSNSKQFKVVTAKSFDREREAEYTVEITCSDKGESPLNGYQEFKVAVLDKNDHTPVFEEDTYFASLPENNRLGAFFLKLNATDLDAGDNAKITYSIHEVPGKKIDSLVHLSADDGILRARTGFDYETHPTLEFVVVATDGGVPPRSTNTTVKLFVLDSNDEPPAFNNMSYVFHVEERDAAVTEVGRVDATDPEEYPHNQVEYMLEGRQPVLETFRINSATGMLRTLKILDRETIDQYLVHVVAADKQAPNLRTTATATIIVDDVNDNYPSVDSPSFRNNSISISNEIPLGHAIIKVSASDADMGPNGQVTYMLYEGNEEEKFTINNTTGILTSTTELDDIRFQAFDLTVLIRDNGEIPKATSIDILIIVDETIPYLGAGGSITDSSNTNLIIIIIVASVSAFLMVLLLVAIIALKMHDRRKVQEEEEELQEAQVILKPRDQEKKSEKKGPVNFRLEVETASGRVVQGSEVPPKNGNRVVSQSANRQRPYADTEKRYVEGAPQVCTSTDNCSSPPPPPPPGQWPPPEDCRLEAHLLALLKRDCSQDAQSASSAELSNADSGHGPSEEGDNHNHSCGTPSKNSRTGETMQSFSSPRQPPRVISPATRGHPVQPRGGSSRSRNPPPPPQRQLYPTTTTASPPSYGDFVRNTRANSSARVPGVGCNANGNGGHSDNAPTSSPVVAQTKNSGCHGNKDTDAVSHGSHDSSLDNVDPEQLQAEINELFFKGVIV